MRARAQHSGSGWRGGARREGPIELILITGGQRSGKSSFGQRRVIGLAAGAEPPRRPVYLATARIWDDELRERVNRHRNDRGAAWQTVETEKEIGGVELAARSVMLLDCITLWLTNYYVDLEADADAALAESMSEWARFMDRARERDWLVTVITNEIGMGVIPDTAYSRGFADLQGFANQRIAAEAHEVYLMVSGLPVQVR